MIFTSVIFIMGACTSKENGLARFRFGTDNRIIDNQYPYTTYSLVHEEEGILVWRDQILNELGKP